jgi:4'-phosphopantetheinyl transferase
MGSTTVYEWQELQTAAHALQLSANEISPKALQQRCFSWLSIDERENWKKFRTQWLRHEYLAARALCRAALSRYTGVAPRNWTFGTSVHGKPKIIGPAEFTSLRFNLAHTSGLVICLVSRVGEVGVDAEETSRVVDVEQVARHFVSRQEKARLENLPPRQGTARFFEQWVLREAYLKGIGKGIASAPERFTIKFGENGEPLPIGTWQFFLYRPSANHVAAAAVRRRRGAAPVFVRWLKANDLFQCLASMKRP